MKFTVDRAVLLKALAHVQSVVERRNTIPILANVLLDAKTDGSLTLTATDMEIAVVEEVAGTAELHYAGARVDHGPASIAVPLYEFEPDADTVLNELLPRFVENIVYTALLESAASEHAARRRAMKSATDNAQELIRSLTQQANQARQTEITQEISEIVGGADALASANAGS